MPGRLRYFLYRDDGIVSQFLEQLEGGVYDAENIRQHASGGAALGLGLMRGRFRETHRGTAHLVLTRS